MSSDPRWSAMWSVQTSCTGSCRGSQPRNRATSARAVRGSWSGMRCGTECPRCRCRGRRFLNGDDPRQRPKWLHRGCSWRTSCPASQDHRKGPTDTAPPSSCFGTGPRFECRGSSDRCTSRPSGRNQGGRGTRYRSCPATRCQSKRPTGAVQPTLQCPQSSLIGSFGDLECSRSCTRCSGHRFGNSRSRRRSRTRRSSPGNTRRAGSSRSCSGGSSNPRNQTILCRLRNRSGHSCRNRWRVRRPRTG